MGWPLDISPLPFGRGLGEGFEAQFVNIRPYIN